MRRKKPFGRSRASTLRRWIRRLWVISGVTFTLYLVLSYQAWGVPPAALESDARVRVEKAEHWIVLRPSIDVGAPALLFFPGGMVEPEAYVPLLRPLAEAGHPVALVKLPFLGRHARTEAERAEAVRRARAAMERVRTRNRDWVVAGHSLGGLLAARYARAQPEDTHALVLLATTHPRDFSLSDASFPVTKVMGTRDGVASPEKARANAANLPPHTRWVEIEGANHSQFGHYGFQLGDGRARISREEQQARVRALLLSALSGEGR